MPSTKKLDTTQFVPFTIAGRTKTGGTAEIISVTWSRVSGDATVEPAGNGTTGRLVAGPTVGNTVFAAMVQADFGDGIISGKEEITLEIIEAGTLPEGASIVVTFGTPGPK